MSEHEHVFRRASLTYADGTPLDAERQPGSRGPTAPTHTPITTVGHGAATGTVTSSVVATTRWRMKHWRSCCPSVTRCGLRWNGVRALFEPRGHGWFCWTNPEHDRPIGPCDCWIADVRAALDGPQ